MCPRLRFDQVMAPRINTKSRIDMNFIEFSQWRDRQNWIFIQSRNHLVSFFCDCSFKAIGCIFVLFLKPITEIICNTPILSFIYKLYRLTIDICKKSRQMTSHTALYLTKVMLFNQMYFQFLLTNVIHMTLSSQTNSSSSCYPLANACHSEQYHHLTKLRTNFAWVLWLGQW